MMRVRLPGRMNLDTLSIGASLLCAIHCALLLIIAVGAVIIITAHLLNLRHCRPGHPHNQP